MNKDETKIEEMSLNLENLIRESSEIQSKIYQINNEINDFENKRDFSGKMKENLKENYTKLQLEKSRISEELNKLSLKEKVEESAKIEEMSLNLENLIRESSEIQSKIYQINNEI